jgi:DNA N-6-adenine-methyltransferase Dam
MTLGSHQSALRKPVVHITPYSIIDATGPYGLDPCAANPRPWDCAKVNWTVRGLDREWPRDLFVYLNPPYDDPEPWIARLARHGHGIALLHARTETGWFEPIWQHASGILFLADRLKFYLPDGTEHRANSGAPPVLTAFGDEALARLQRCGIPGALVTGWNWRASVTKRKSARGGHNGQT